MRRTVAESLGAVHTHTHTHTHTLYLLENERGISFYALLKLYIRDGTEYNNAVKKVIESKGFWIGRYETSGMNSSNNDIAENIVAGKGTSDGINNIIWYGMYKQQQNYVSKKNLDTSKIQSTMIFGAALDQAMLFANCANETIPKKDYSTVITGNVETDCYRNIYDLCGNLYELTTEACYTNGRVDRGRQL